LLYTLFDPSFFLKIFQNRYIYLEEDIEYSKKTFKIIEHYELGVLDPGGVVVIDLSAAIMMAETRATVPALGSFRKVFQSYIARIPNTAMRTAAI
jgi:hypothetical protein